MIVGPLAMAVLLLGCGTPPSGPSPPASLDAAASVERGRAVFVESCAICHGEHADGRGIRRHALTTRPRDFTQPGWKEQLPPQRLFEVIRDGKQGTAMPAWRALGDDAIWDLVSYLRSVPDEG